MQQVHYHSAASEFYDAFRSTRRAYGVFWIVIGVSLLVQIASFALVNWVGVVDPLERPGEAARTPVTVPENDAPVAPDADPQPEQDQVPPPQEDGAPEPAANGDEPQTVADAPEQRVAGPDEQQIARAGTWRMVLQWLLPATKFAAFLGAALMVLLILLAVKVSMLDRVGGTAGFVSAFTWSLLLLAILVPWQHVFPAGEVYADDGLWETYGYASGATYGYVELVDYVRLIRTDWQAQPDLWTQITVYARTLALPILALLIWIMVQVRWARGSSAMRAAARLGGPDTARGGPDIARGDRVEQVQPPERTDDEREEFTAG